MTSKLPPGMYAYVLQFIFPPVKSPFSVRWALLKEVQCSRLEGLNSSLESSEKGAASTMRVALLVI